MGKDAVIMHGALVAMLLAAPVSARAAVVYVDPASARWQTADQEVTDPDPDPDRDRLAGPGSVWGEIERTGRIAAEQAGVAGRTATARANGAVFAQAMAIHLNLSEGASVERFFDFRIPAESDDALAAQPRQRTLIDLILGSDVPEPGAWLYMIFGFGLVGGMLRRRGHGARVPGNGLPGRNVGRRMATSAF